MARTWPTPQCNQRARRVPLSTVPRPSSWRMHDIDPHGPLWDSHDSRPIGTGRHLLRRMHDSIADPTEIALRKDKEVPAQFQYLPRGSSDVS